MLREPAVDVVRDRMTIPRKCNDVPARLSTVSRDTPFWAEVTLGLVQALLAPIFAVSLRRSAQVQRVIGILAASKRRVGIEARRRS
jgi:hypothetical protein